MHVDVIPANMRNMVSKLVDDQAKPVVCICITGLRESVGGDFEREGQTLFRPLLVRRCCWPWSGHTIRTSRKTIRCSIRPSASSSGRRASLSTAVLRVHHLKGSGLQTCKGSAKPTEVRQCLSRMISSLATQSCGRRSGVSCRCIATGSARTKTAMHHPMAALRCTGICKLLPKTARHSQTPKPIAPPLDAVQVSGGMVSKDCGSVEGEALCFDQDGERYVVRVQTPACRYPPFPLLS